MRYAIFRLHVFTAMVFAADSEVFSSSYFHLPLHPSTAKSYEK